MADFSDSIKSAFSGGLTGNLGSQGIKKAYDRVTGTEDEEEKKKRLRLAALKRMVDNGNQSE